MTEDITIEELLEYYRANYKTLDDDVRAYYFGKTTEVVEYLMIGKFEVLPYRNDDGVCDYRLRVRT